MHCLLLSLVAVVGADTYIYDNNSAQAATTNATGVVNLGHGHGHGGGDCDSCQQQGGHGNNGRLRACGPMPQSCYDPKVGCYGGNDRRMQRYPAFHGTYYRRPYNYRNLFDYPWHADLHEPTSLFSYNVPGANENQPGVPSPADAAARAQRGPTVASPIPNSVRR